MKFENLELAFKYTKGFSRFFKPRIGGSPNECRNLAFFDTYQTPGVATEIMGITKEGEKAVEQMKKK